MGSSLDSKKVDELLDKYRALAEKEQRRLNELEERDAHFLSEVCTSLTVTGSAFSTSYLRGYLGDKAAIWGIPIDAGIAFLFHGLAGCFGFSVAKGAQKAAKFFHDVGNGALASWTSTIGADLGEQKRKAKPVPASAPQPNTGAVAPMQETLTRESGPVTKEELAAAAAAVGWKMQPTMLQRPASPAPPIPAQQTVNPLPKNEPAAAKAPALAPQSAMPPQSPSTAPQAPAASTATSDAEPRSPPIPQRPYRFTQRVFFDLDPSVRTHMQSLEAIPLADTKASLQWLSREYSLDKLEVVLRWANMET